MYIYTNYALQTREREREINCVFHKNELPLSPRKIEIWIFLKINATLNCVPEPFVFVYHRHCLDMVASIMGELIINFFLLFTSR